MPTGHDRARSANATAGLKISHSAQRQLEEMEAEEEGAAITHTCR
eukprot:SAG11_NODE_4368_length_1930_cov_1.593665_3_plen_45_part_00